MTDPDRDRSISAEAPGHLRVAVVGAGAVGRACLLSVVERGIAREVALVNRNEARARAVALDMGYGSTLGPPTDIVGGGYDATAGADLLILTLGVNEAGGGATDRSDPQGRLRLLKANADVYRDVIPKLVEVAPDATLMVVTDPPDPLADVARAVAGHERVFSTGTLLDSIRFRVHIARQLRVLPNDVQATVLGEHGTSHVPLWSSATVAGTPVLDALAAAGEPIDQLREKIEHEVRFANISIIDGIGASQYGIARVSARLAEAVLRDERSIFPVAAYSQQFATTLSLPTVVGRSGARRAFLPVMTEAEESALAHSAEVLREAVASVL